MRITQAQLRQIIKEEMSNMMDEVDLPSLSSMTGGFIDEDSTEIIKVICKFDFSVLGITERPTAPGEIKLMVKSFGEDRYHFTIGKDFHGRIAWENVLMLKEGKGPVKAQVWLSPVRHQQHDNPHDIEIPVFVSRV